MTKKEKVSNGNKTKTRIVFFIVVLMFFGILGSIEDENEKKETGNILQDIVYDTETSSSENKKYVDVTRKIYKPMKSEYKELNTTINAISSSDLLEPSSFKDIEKMKKIVSDLNSLITKLEKYKKKVLETKDNAREIAIESLGEAEGEIFYSDFEEGFNKVFVYMKKNNDAGKEYFNNLISLYNFLINNHSDYEVDYDEYGEENIYFYSDYNLNKSNQYIKENNELYEKLILSENEYNDYVNNNLKEYNLSVDDIENSFMK